MQPHRRTRFQPTSVIVLAFLALVVAGFGVVYVSKTPKVENAGVTVGFTPAPTSPTAGDTQTALFVGDSWAAGYGAGGFDGLAPLTDASKSFPTLTSAALGWAGSTDGVGGSGYISDGTQDGKLGASNKVRPYGERLNVDVQTDPAPTYVVVTGGRNDRYYPTAQVVAGMSAYLTAARAAYPSATMFVVAPFWSDGNPPAELTDLRDAMRGAAATIQATFIDPLAEQWITDANAAQYIGPDDDHPTAEGHQYIAGRLVADLRVQTGS